MPHLQIERDTKKVLEFNFDSPLMKWLIKYQFKDLEVVKNFEAKTADFLNFMETMPVEIDMKNMSLVDYCILKFKDGDKANEELKEEINRFIKFVWVITSFKVDKLIYRIFEFLDESDFYNLAILCRTLIEVVSICHYTLYNLKPHITSLNKNKWNYLDYALAHQRIEELTSVFYFGNKNKILLDERTDATIAKSSSIYISHIKTMAKYEKLGQAYGMLSEIIHQNQSSNQIFGELTESWEGKLKKIEEESILILPGEIDKFHRDLPEGPKAMWGVMNLGPIISTISMCMDVFKESVEIGSTLSAEKCEVISPETFLFNLLKINKQKELIDLCEGFKHLQGISSSDLNKAIIDFFNKNIDENEFQLLALKFNLKWLN